MSFYKGSVALILSSKKSNIFSGKISDTRAVISVYTASIDCYDSGTHSVFSI